jgi:hypothetical protein
MAFRLRAQTAVRAMTADDKHTRKSGEPATRDIP